MTKTVRALTLLYQVQLEDEMPVIGSGWRFVFAREGTKWVFVLDPFSINTVKLSLSKWKGVKKTLWEDGTYIRNYLHERLEKLGRTPTVFEMSALKEE